MNGGMGRAMPPFGNDPYKNKPKPPKGIKDIPRYLWELVSGFVSRFGYIVGMVWKTGPWILIVMVMISALNGILPVVGSLISKEILNELQNVIVADATGVGAAAVFWGSMAMSLLIFFFIYKIINQLVSRINIAVTRIAGEKVGRF